MALALELSRRLGQPQTTPQKPQIQNRLHAEPDRSHPSHYTAPTHRSFSSAPFYNYGGVAGSSEDDEDDEDLQMALACSLSEMEAKQRAAATDYISGAGGRGRAGGKVNGHRGDGDVKTKHLNVAGSAKVDAEEKDEKNVNMAMKGTWEPEFSPDSPTSSNTTPPSQCSEEELEASIRNSDGSVKKKKKCGCAVC